MREREKEKDGWVEEESEDGKKGSGGAMQERKKVRMGGKKLEEKCIL